MSWSAVYLLLYSALSGTSESSMAGTMASNSCCCDDHFQSLARSGFEHLESFSDFETRTSISSQNPSGEVASRCGWLVSTEEIKDSPLLVAAFEGDLKALDTLLRGGADVNVESARGVTPLYAAAKSGKMPLLCGSS